MHFGLHRLPPIFPSRGVCLGGARLGNRTLKRAEPRICRMSHSSTEGNAIRAAPLLVQSLGGELLALSQNHIQSILASQELAAKALGGEPRWRRAISPCAP